MKAQVNFKMYDVTDWQTNNCNTHIAQYLTRYRQPDNEIWSVIANNFRNTILQKLCRKEGVETKQVVSTLVSIHFGRPPLGCTIKTNCITYQAVDSEI